MNYAMPTETFSERLLRQCVSPRAKDRLAALFLILLPPVFFWRESLGWLTLGDQDAVFWFFPAYKFAAEQIQTGMLPLWNPYQYGGLPFFAEWQSGVLDPLNWIHWLGATSRTLTLSLELSFAVGLLGMFSYARSLGFARRAAVFSAVVFALSGFLVGRTLYPGFLRIVALSPLVLYFTERLSQRGRWRDAVFGALIIAWQIFAAHPQPLIYSSLLACAYAIFKFPISNLRAHPRFLSQFALMFIGGIGLASVQLFPAFEFAAKSVRQDWPFELFTLHSLHPASLAVTLFPFFHGSGKTIYQLPYWGAYWHHNEAQIYLGALALALAAAGTIAAWRARYRVGMFWSLVAVAGAILAMGKYTGWLANLLYHVPLISHFRSPNRHWMAVTMAVAVLAGYAVDRLLKEESPFIARCARSSSAVVALLCCAVGGLALWQTERLENLLRSMADMRGLPQGFLQSARWEFLLPMIAAVCACLAVVAFARTRRRARWFAVLLAVLIVDFNLYAAFAPINNPAKLESLIGRAMPPTLASRQSEREPIRYQVMLNTATGEFNPFWFYGHEMMPGYDPLLGERQGIFSGLDAAGRCLNPTMLDARDHTLDLFNARYVLVPPAYFDTNSMDASSRWRALDERSTVAPYSQYRVYENLRALPRAWLASRAKAAGESDQLKMIRGQIPDFNPRTTALVDQATAAKLDQSLLQASTSREEVRSTGFSRNSPDDPQLPPEGGTTNILSRAPAKLAIETEAAKPSLLVMSEMFYPGWTAKLDGGEVDLWRVNYNLRGLQVPAGKHLVELSYRPKSLVAGAVVSVTTALCLLIIFVLERRREKRLKGAGAAA